MTLIICSSRLELPCVDTNKHLLLCFNCASLEDQSSGLTLASTFQTESCLQLIFPAFIKIIHSPFFSICHKSSWLTQVNLLFYNSPNLFVVETSSTISLEEFPYISLTIFASTLSRNGLLSFLSQSTI